MGGYERAALCGFRKREMVGSFSLGVVMSVGGFGNKWVDLGDEN